MYDSYSLFWQNLNCFPALLLAAVKGDVEAVRFFYISVFYEFENGSVLEKWLSRVEQKHLHNSFVFWLKHPCIATHPDSWSVPCVTGVGLLLRRGESAGAGLYGLHCSAPGRPTRPHEDCEFYSGARWVRDTHTPVFEYTEFKVCLSHAQLG